MRRELGREDPDFVTEEPQRLWTEILTRLDAHLEHPVEIVVRAVLRVGDDAQQRLRSALVRTHGREPLTATADVDGDICEVDEPSWAGWLGALDFVGRPMESIGALIQSEVGDIRVEMLHSQIPGVEQLAIEVDAPSGQRHLQLQRFVDAATGRDRAFLTEVDAAPAPIAE